MFDDIDRKNIEKLGLNCVVIDEGNKNKTYSELGYFDLDDPFLSKNVNIQSAVLLDTKTFEDFGIKLYGFPILIIDPRFWNDIYIEIMNKYKIEVLIFSIHLTVFLKKPTVKKTTLTSLNFLKSLKHLRQFYLQPQKDVIFEQYWDIKDFTPLEYLENLEYLNIPNSDTYVDIDFSKLKNLKEVNLQFPKENKSIYQCKKLERLTTRTFLEDFKVMKELKNLEYFVSYAGDLKSFSGVGALSSLKTLDLEISMKVKELVEIESLGHLEEFVLRNAKGMISLGKLYELKKLQRLLFSDIRKLESSGDINSCKSLKLLVFENSIIPKDLTLEECVSLKELKFENCKFLNDFNQIGDLKNLESLELIDCKEIESLEFVKKLKKLKYLNFAGNTVIKDGNLDFLKEFSERDVYILFRDRRHYSVKLEDINEELTKKLNEVSGDL